MQTRKNAAATRDKAKSETKKMNTSGKRQNEVLRSTPMPRKKKCKLKILKNVYRLKRDKMALFDESGILDF